ncbi:hypothetical protein, variant [Phytophthora nicotianae]|uniref:RRM domain-containing protein n=1 Tax=Phytophthora nicotianae TaxID=4792 RepID=W2JSN7_PHYNI|nr:hypothetical protein L916_01125 [Phytophthora nicotianae]ETL49371.1 hypothetical protein, variant [Phytophthora nicotianae]
MGRREEEAESGRRHGRHGTSPSPTRGEDNEEAIRNKLRESGWKKRRTESESTADAEASKDEEKTKNRAEMGSPRPADDRRSSRTSRSTRRSRSPRRRDREHRSSRRKSSGSRRRSPSRSRSPASRSRSRSRSTGRRRRRHSSSSRKRRTSLSPSRTRDSKRSRRMSRSRSTSATKKKTPEKKKEKEKKDDDETETENEEEADTNKKEEKVNGEKQEKPEKQERSEDRHRSRKSSRRSRSPSPRSPSRSSRRRRHRRSYSRSRSPSRSRRARRGGSRSRSPRRSRGRDRDRDRRRRRRSYSRSRSPSYSRRRRRDRSSSRDRPRRDTKEPAEPQPATDTAAPSASTTAPAAPAAGVNPTITQLMAQYPTMSLQDIIAKMQASNVTMAAAVAQKPARELYVGNLPPNVTGPQLQEFLSTIIQQVGLTTQPGNPIINTWTSTDGHFAFCEMRSVEECNLALLLNQLSLLGQPLKFGRPRSFMGPPQPMPQVSARTQTALTNLGCTPNPAWFAQPTVPSTETTTESTLAEATLSAIAAAQPATAEAGSGHRLIMSNIPVVLTEDQVKELVEPFGKLKSFTLVKDTATGASLGSALFEYEDKDVADQAVEGLNGLSIGGILLSVQRQPPNAAALPSAAVTPEDQPSAVLKMANMVSIDELRDDEEYADLAEDVEEECKRFGSVTGMEIPRPKDGEEIPGLGCIYVRFGKEEDAVSALKALNGRKFGGNIVKVTYFPLDKFEKNELF